jgi:hypothetical protein
MPEKFSPVPLLPQDIEVLNFAAIGQKTTHQR